MLIGDGDKVSVGNRPWGTVSHVSDFDVSVLIENFVFDTGGVEFFQYPWRQQEFNDFFDGVVDNGCTLGGDVPFELDFGHFTRFIRVLLPSRISLEFLEIFNDLLSLFKQLFRGRLSLFLHLDINELQ